MTIGENLRRIRMQRGLGQVELAQLAGLTQPTISEIETEHRGAQTRTLQKLAAALSVPVSMFFLEDEGAPKVPPPPKTRLASSTTEEIETKLYGAPVKESAGEPQPVLSEPQVRELSDAARRERDALEGWLEEYASAPQGEKFERRADHDWVKALRDRARFYHDWLFDCWSKLYDPRPAPFKSAQQFAAQTVEARNLFLSALQNDDEIRRVEGSGQAG
jgi:transcriptional regulator with XRE-family HTH domain